MATITLSVLRCPDSVVPGQHRASGGEVSIGRGAECDWQLEDPDRVLSKRHCVLEFYSGGWQVRDLSTNGTFHNHGSAPIGRDQVKPLLDGDRIRLGAYEIEVRIEEAAASSGGWGSADPFAAASAATGFGNAPLPGMGAPAAIGGGSLLPDDFDPFGDAAAAPMPDHAPSTAEAFMPRPALPAGKSLIPDDWDLDLSPTAPAPAPAPVAAPPPAAFAPPPPPPPAAFAPPPPPPAAFAPPPPPPAAFAPPPPPPAAFAPPPPPPAAFTPPPAPTANPFAEPGDPLGDPGDLAPAPMPIAAAPIPAAPPPPAPMPLAPVAAAAPGPGSIAALIEGAGLPQAMASRAEADPDAALKAAGALLRAAVAGIRALLIARADVKREFRIEQTMLRAANNNPLKFAATEEQALAALLDPKTPALKAMQETVDDLTAHQVATLAATQAAARALLDRLSPAAIEGEDGGGGGLLPGAKEKRLWEAYRRRHQLLLEQFEDDFDSAFGKAFARAYEQAMGKTGG